MSDLTTTQLAGAATKIAAGIDSTLISKPETGPLGFIQGTNEQLRPLDAQTWRNVTIGGGEGPLQADRTVTTSPVYEYHVWPAAAATSWAILAVEGLAD